MLFMNQSRIYGQTYREEAGGDGEGGGAGDGDAGGAPNTDELQTKVNELQSQLESVLAKNNELLGESKKAKAARREAERAAEEQAKAKAEAEGNFQQLYESSEKERGTLAEQLMELQSSVKHEKEMGEAMKLAVALGPVSDGAAEDLAEKIAKRLKLTDDGVKVTDSNGNLTVSSLDDLKKEISGSARFSHLIKGNQSSGGGAAGGSSGGGASKEMTRTEFNGLDPIAQAKFMKSGGKLTD